MGIAGIVLFSVICLLGSGARANTNTPLWQTIEVLGAMGSQMNQMMAAAKLYNTTTTNMRNNIMGSMETFAAKLDATQAALVTQFNNSYTTTQISHIVGLMRSSTFNYVSNSMNVLVYDQVNAIVNQSQPYIDGLYASLQSYTSPMANSHSSLHGKCASQFMPQLQMYANGIGKLGDVFRLEVAQIEASSRIIMGRMIAIQQLHDSLNNLQSICTTTACLNEFSGINVYNQYKVAVRSVGALMSYFRYQLPGMVNRAARNARLVRITNIEGLANTLPQYLKCLGK